MSQAVKTSRATARTRRSAKAEATYQAIVAAAYRLFLERGYVPTTIDAIAQEADVAVETVYARFRNKANLMVAVKDAAVTEQGQVPLNERPELAVLARESDPRRRVHLAAALSRAMLERIAPVYALLRTAADTDNSLREHLAAVIERRRRFQLRLVELIRGGDELRAGMTNEYAADTYTALASPDLYLLLTTHHGWTADRFQAWLDDTLQQLLLSPTSSS